MTFFAAHDDHSIYAVADSREAAIAKARSDAMDPSARFETAEISDDLAAYIDENGWYGHARSFDVRDGQIIDTTGD